MGPELDRLKELLSRLRELEQGSPARHGSGAAEPGRTALRDEVTRIARALRDNSYGREPAPAAARGDQRHAG